MNDRLLVIIVDGEHARFMKLNDRHALETIKALDSTTAHQLSREIGTDKPGRGFGPAARHAFQPKHDLHQIEKDRFVRMIASDAASFAADHEFLLVAPSACLRLLGNYLPEERIAGRIAKDLVNIPDSELWTYLRPWVGRPRRFT